MMDPVFYHAEADDLIRGEVIVWAVGADLDYKGKKIGRLEEAKREFLEPYVLLPGLWRPATIRTLDRGLYAYLGFHPQEVEKIWKEMLIEKGRGIVFDRAGRRLEKKLRRAPTEDEIVDLLKSESAAFWVNPLEPKEKSGLN